MAEDEKRRQKALLKKRRKDKFRKQKSREKIFDVTGALSYAQRKNIIRKATNFPIFECFINSVWKKEGLATILISRKMLNGNLIFGHYLVDIFCLGAKDAFCNADISFDEYESLKEEMDETSPIISCHVRLAHRIIYGAIEYASNLGFNPHKDYELAKFVLDPPSEADLDFDVEFGKDGKPFYISGPNDDVDYILNKLRNKVGESNFHFLMI